MLEKSMEFQKNEHGDFELPLMYHQALNNLWCNSPISLKPSPGARVVTLAVLTWHV